MLRRLTSLFGGQQPPSAPQQPADDDPLAQALRALMLVQPIEETRKAVHAWQHVMLSDSFEQLLGFLLQQAKGRGDAEAAGLIADRQDLIASCREIGIDPTFDLLAFVLGNPRAFNQIMVSFINAPTWSETKRLVEAQRQTLLSVFADQFIAHLLTQYPPGTPQHPRLQEHRELLVRCRREGIEAAFADRLPPPVPATVTPELVDQLLATSSQTERDTFLAQHPELEPVLERLQRFEALMRQALQLNQLQDLPQKAELLRAALTLADESRWRAGSAMAHFELGRAYTEPQLGDQDAAIAHFEAALEMYTREQSPKEWGDVQNNLGIVYFQRADGDRRDNLRLAIAHFEATLEVRDRETAPFDWAQTQQNLGGIYANYTFENPAEQIERAIDCLSRALEVYTREAFPLEWAKTQERLSQAYRRQTASGQADNLERASACLRRAQEVYTASAAPARHAALQFDLMSVYAERLQALRADALGAAIVALVNTRSADALKQLAAADQELLLTDEATQALAGLASPARAQGDEEVALLLEEHQGLLIQQRGPALLALLDEINASRESTDYARRAQLCRTALRLVDRALPAGMDIWAYLHSALGDALSRDWEGDRAENLEQPLDELARARREVGAALHQARAEYRQLVEEIRAWDSFFVPADLDIDRILELIPPDSALVMPLLTSQGSAALVLPNGLTAVTDQQVLWLDDLTSADIQLLRAADLGTLLDDEASAAAQRPLSWMLAYAATRQRKTPETQAAWQAATTTLTRRLWDMIMGPIHTRLAEQRVTRVVLLPPGDLQVLPLHAAWREIDGVRRAFLDDFEVRYAPSLYTLDTCVRRQSVRERERSGLVAGVAEYRGLAPLPNARLEAGLVAGLLGAQPLLDADVTSEALFERSPASAYLHLACHATYAWIGDPLDSALILASEQLTLGQMLTRLDLQHARLVTLSACETGVVDTQRGADELIGLPAGFLQAGAPAVVSSLWAVDDLSTVLLMERFYIDHLGGTSAPRALRQAQIWLREATARELAERFALERAKPDEERRMAYEQASEAWRRFARMSPDERPFANPIYWAPFTFSGA